MAYYLFLIIITKTTNIILIVNFCKENVIYNKLQYSKFYTEFYLIIIFYLNLNLSSTKIIMLLLISFDISMLCYLTHC